MCTTTFPIFYPLAKLPPLDGEVGSSAQSTVAIAPLPLPSSINTSKATPAIVKFHEVSRNTSTNASPLHRAPLSARLKANTTTGTFVLERVPACMTWCTQVETLCPYFNPSDATSNGGEPTFLCDGTWSRLYLFRFIYWLLFKPFF